MTPTGEPIRIPIVFNEEDSDTTAIVARAMTTARHAQTKWSLMPMKQRLQRVRRLRCLIASNAKQLAAASAGARQRPITESLTAEVMPLAEACRFLERHAGRLLGHQKLGRRGKPLWLAGVHSEIERVPLGVVLIIGPGNYPLLLPGVQLIQALVAGNAVLLKPGVGGTSAALELCRLAVSAGFSPELISVLPESTNAVCAAIHSRPDKVIFTGSTATGELILAQLAPHLIPATMELSGKDAVIIRGDADLDLAFKALTFGLMLNGGATCMSPKRVFVHQSMATELEGRLAQYFGQGIVSSTNALNAKKRLPAPSSHAGTGSPVTSSDTESNKVLRRLISDALVRGAHLIAGEIRSDGMLITPVVLAGVPAESELLQRDFFAPVLAIITVTDDREAILRANDSRLALTVSIFSRDEGTARSLASQLNAGTVLINDLIVPTADPRLPFGGRKRSGFGVTRGAEGLLEMTTPKVVTVSRSKFRPAFEPPNAGDEKMFEAYLRLTHGPNFSSRWTALRSLIGSVLRRQKS